MALLILSFIAGLLTVLAPCILPLLPIIIGGSLDPMRHVRLRHATTVVFSLGASVIVFTFLLKASTAFIAIPQAFWTYLSGGIVFFFGLTLLFPGFWERLPFIARLNARSTQLVSTGYQRKSFWGNVLIGAALGPVFATCSPTYFIVLATVLPQNFALGVLDMFAYVAGLCLALLAIAIFGQRLADRLGFAADPHGNFKRVLGIVFVIVGVVIFTGYDKKAQIKLLEWGIFDITKVEQRLLQFVDPSGKPILPQNTPIIFDEGMRVEKKVQLFERAPEIMKPAGFVNTNGQPITIGEFRGKKVVLLDIWTYSCINCQRTIPYLKAWDDKYRDQGLQIIGIHTPEFAFEKDAKNVEWAVQQFGIKYPSVLDNDYETWRALGNNYWPRKYLVDIDGFIVYDHIGEGAYEETEAAIQRALMERSMVVGEGMPGTDIVAAEIEEADLSGIGSPETYFGALRNEYFANGDPGALGSGTFAVPENIIRNALYLEGEWNITEEYAETKSRGKIIYRYNAKDVYLVASALDGVTITVLRDGKPVGDFAGGDIDVATSRGEVREHRLYKLVHDEEPGEHVLEIQIDGAGLEAYAFTFG
ncbi:redoxin family protein [Candidatus Kaiserbacteria bacterium]|nr:redoxin family protein [Candidatus Kaiserbacteria bacterium]